jgi:hypothetical protein
VGTELILLLATRLQTEREIFSLEGFALKPYIREEASKRMTATKWFFFFFIFLFTRHPADLIGLCSRVFVSFSCSVCIVTVSAGQS